MYKISFNKDAEKRKVREKRRAACASISNFNAFYERQKQTSVNKFHERLYLERYFIKEKIASDNVTDTKLAEMGFICG